MRMIRITPHVPTAAVVAQFGVVLAVAGLIGWHLCGPAKAPVRPESPRSAGRPQREAPSDPAPAPGFKRDCERLLKELDDIQERMARAESSMPPVRARQVDLAAVRRREIEEGTQTIPIERWHLEWPIYIVPAPVR